jgi:hypothetical protein
MRQETYQRGGSWVTYLVLDHLQLQRFLQIKKILCSWRRARRGYRSCGSCQRCNAGYTWRRRNIKRWRKIFSVEDSRRAVPTWRWRRRRCRRRLQLQELRAGSPIPIGMGERRGVRGIGCGGGGAVARRRQRESTRVGGLSGSWGERMLISGGITSRAMRTLRALSRPRGVIASSRYAQSGRPSGTARTIFAGRPSGVAGQPAPIAT